ncbi:hypothetical protein LEM8419_01020 [Neolewinella maritima]|uniref:DUF2254 domain-containing protein n=1 Tax=Neolewinella maritima TaxID=1383882 RepID=A0ABM9AYC4_9BACT|nr:DUF2254 domain-containing protein [Neolewinella maritima]CAH0999720.1 hypothetical protein LEM8419_01020 [Neolewinella maritima]
MQQLYRILQTFMKQAVRSVAFLPVPMIVASVLLGFLFFWLENATSISKWTQDTFPALAITSQDTARTILGMFIGGLITLTVFTFSQIMILLNQVASSYSPRLLPKLTGDRALQFVMGLNLATIVLTITVLLSIRSSDDFKIPNFSILICTILGITCLCLFVYFVTAITKKIQVDSIVDASAQDTIDGLKDERDLGDAGYSDGSIPAGVRSWYPIMSPISGYLGVVNHRALSKLGHAYDTTFYIGVSKGQYVPEGQPLLQSKELLDEEQIDRVLTTVSPIRDQFDDWYLPNLKQLTEIALKAMSPGINDPGTAIMVIDRQTEVLIRMMDTPFHNYFRAKEGGDVWFVRHNFEDILAALMQEMRRYAKEDPLVVRALFQMLYHLLHRAGTSLAYTRSVLLEIRALLEDARSNIPNTRDRSLIARDIRVHRRAIHHLAQLKGRTYALREVNADAAQS